ncbi:hypothetical protein RKE25_22755 (plasmid) [Dyella sp. BiH032]|uniref:hypothetical protein n=1 Tax=Dyella sp. BiH032 TaxID=3075430 RepID=UPI002892AA2F|nr:hypothetical protein [Dyella sp. BiH032]WNL48356.1 hypothetical protein RKE25_22755 [Dyella sp. BiH032]
MTAISSRKTGQSALIDMAGDIANDAIRLSERHRKVKLASRLFSGGTLGVAVSLLIMGVWHYFAAPSVTFRSLDVPQSIVSAAAQAASGAASLGGSPFDSIASMIFTGPFPIIMAVTALVVGLALSVVRGSFSALVGAGAFAFAMFMGPQMFGAMFPSSGNDGATAAAAVPEKPAEWQAWLKDHPKEASTDAGRYLAAQVAYLTKNGALKVALLSWPGTLSASSEIDPSRVIVMERSAFNEARSSMAEAKLADYQHTRDRLRAASSSAALWLAALVVATLVTRRLRKTMGARVESAMGYLATREAKA